MRRAVDASNSVPGQCLLTGSATPIGLEGYVDDVPAWLPSSNHLSEIDRRAHVERDDRRVVAIDELERASMIIGGVAVIALGIPRYTADIDATLAGADLDLGQLVEVLGRHGIHPRIPDAVVFARSTQVLLGLHEASGTPIDVSLAWLPFEEEALEASVACDYAGVEEGQRPSPCPDESMMHRAGSPRAA